VQNIRIFTNLSNIGITLVRGDKNAFANSEI